MRKLNKGRKLSRKKGPREALLRTLANSLFLHEKIKTTEAKAKELRIVAEKIITKAKKNDLSGRRLIAGTLTSVLAKKAVQDIAARYSQRRGGYTKISRLGPRLSDGAKMAIIEFVK